MLLKDSMKDVFQVVTMCVLGRQPVSHNEDVVSFRCHRTVLDPIIKISNIINHYSNIKVTHQTQNLSHFCPARQ